MRDSYPAALVVCICVTMICGTTARAAPSLPAVLAQATSFHGHIVYQAHRADDSSATVTGTLFVTSDGWTLEERSAQSVLHASNEQSWIRTGSQTVVFDDPFEVGVLANSWAVALASSYGTEITRDAGGTSWTTVAGTRFYLDTAQSDFIGIADTRATDGVSFAYSDWIDVNGLRLPQTIVRMRDGVTDAAFAVDSYQVQWAFDDAAAKAVVRDTTQAPQAAPLAVVAAATTPSPWRPFGALFALLVLALGIVAWTRRDALTEHLSQRLATDPRAWRTEGVSLFVSPEGVLIFEGRPYRVGAAFFNRMALVQSSPLFIRVSAPDVPRVMILARKFPLPINLRASTKRSAAGFTLIEAMAATALFAAVIIGAVFPAMIVLAHADRLAAQHQAALQIASNALADEQAALAYSTTGISDGVVTSSVDGMKLTVTVSPSGIAWLHVVAVDVTDASNRTLARVVTMVGPPVLPPSSPPPGPPSSGSSP